MLTCEWRCEGEVSLRVEAKKNHIVSGGITGVGKDCSAYNFLKRCLDHGLKFTA